MTIQASLLAHLCLNWSGIIVYISICTSWKALSFSKNEDHFKSKKIVFYFASFIKLVIASRGGCFFTKDSSVCFLNRISIQCG